MKTIELGGALPVDSSLSNTSSHSSASNHPEKQVIASESSSVTIPNRQAYIVTFDGPNDPWNAKSWSSSKKLTIAMIVCYGTWVATFNSALFAAGSSQASHHFSHSPELGKLGTTLYVLGFTFGPPIWAPGSELIGRKTPLVIGMLGSSIFTIASAVSKDIQTLIITRFFAGIFGASPLCVAPGVLSDIYDGLARETAIAVYALSIFIGPLIAPFIGGFITTSYLGWWWTLYPPAILGFSDLLLLLFFVQEMYPPVMMAKKAAQLRKASGHWMLHAEHERLEVNVHQLVRKYLTKPIQMLLWEFPVLLLTVYVSFVYGLVYALLGAYPYVFEHVHGFSQGVAGLPFIALAIGVTLGVCYVVWYTRCSHRRAARSGKAIVPEVRLVPTMIGAPAFTIGLFWFAWTGYTASVHWMVPVVSGILTGFGILTINLPCFSYLVEAYLPVTASTVAANVMLRSTVGAVFPLFSVQMFQNLGIQWAGTLLGCIAALMIPVPFLVQRYGAAIRARSKLLAEFAVPQPPVEKAHNMV